MCIEAWLEPCTLVWLGWGGGSPSSQLAPGGKQISKIGGFLTPGRKIEALILLHHLNTIPHCHGNKEEIVGEAN